MATSFRHKTEDHDSVDPVCLAPGEDELANERIFHDLYHASVMVISAEGQQVGFGLVRHMIEIGLKNSIWGSVEWPPEAVGHDLNKLMGKLPDDHPVVVEEVSDAADLAAFVRELHRHDPKGDAGRYGQHLDGTECLAEVCCIERDDLLRFADLAYRYLAV